MRWWPILRYSLSICLEQLKKITMNLNQYRRPQGRDTTLQPSECEAGMLNTIPQRRVKIWA
jgi:hypothetical protein